MVEADDPQALAAGILAALDQRARFDGDAIARRVTSRFGRDAWSQQAIAIYRQLVAA